MPRAITIDGVLVDDSNHPEDYQGLYLFTDPDEMPTEDTVTLTTERPFPYELCHTIRIRQLATTSGKKPQVAPNLELAKSIVVIEEA